jgi:hypothetical protein
MNDNLYTRTSNFLVSLDSRHATNYYNGSFNSDVEFSLETPIKKPHDSINFSTSILAFTAPNSIYIINEYNNLFKYSIGSNNYSVYVLIGNYNVNTFITQFLSQMPNNFNITYNSITNKFTISYISSWSILIGSTIFEIMGFDVNTLYVSNSGIINLPFTCNFNGVSHINIHSDTFNTSNIISKTLSTCSILQPIIVNCNSSQIIFQKTTIFEIPVNNNIVDTISIQIKDDDENLINFNGCHWSLVIHFSLIEDIERFPNETSFNNILNYS